MTLRPRVEVERSFRGFALDEEPRSELYALLAAAILKDEELLAIAACARPGQPPAHQLFGAAHFLLLSGLSHPLAAYYPTLGGPQAPDAEAPRAFRELCLGQRRAVEELVATRLTQTNETRRCAYLYPAFATVAATGEGRPLALIELGPSAGLNMCWDRYSYDYGAGLRCGAAGSPVRITTELRGPVPPPLPEQAPAVMWRAGVDLSPVDIDDEAAVRWLEALIWPEHTERVTRLRAAITVAREARPPIIAGDALALLPELIAAAPADATLCLYHTHVTYQFTQAMRAQLDALLRAAARQRTVMRLSCEGGRDSPPQLLLEQRIGERRDEWVLADTSGHASWVAWRAEARAGQ
jgi:hypothetical protein